MFKNFVTFKDAVNLTVQEVPNEVRDFYTEHELTSANITPLRSRIAATHAARPTRNNGLYLPDKMKKGTSTFLKPFPKPILTHHDHRSDAIGRVADAKYIDTSNGIQDIQDSFNAGYLQNLRNFIDGRMPKKEAVDFALEFLDGQNAFDADFEGLGYVEIIAEITNPDAIRKVIDKRYLTGSVNASTNSAICSICKVDWAEEDRCEHVPGEVYDGKVCLLVAGDLLYHEYSFVNKPADTISYVIETSVNGITDSVQVKPYTTNEQPQRASVYEIALFETKQGDHSMTFKQVMDLLRQSGKFEEVAFEDKSFLDSVKTAMKTSTELDGLLVELKDFVKEDTQDSERETEDAVKDFFGDAYDEVVGDDPWGRQYAEMLLTLLEDAEDPEVAKKEIEDAKLSASARKKLPDSAFCGPDRSFPVNDCAHHTAALRMLSRYEGAGSKDKIRACINRKGKRLGCTEPKDEARLSPTEFLDVAYFDQFEDNEVADMFKGLLLAIEDRNLDCGCPDNKEKVQALEDEIKKLKEADGSVNTDEKLQKLLDASRTEIRYLQEDIEHMTQSLMDRETAIRKLYAQQIADFTALSGTATTVDEVLDSIKEDKEADLEQKLKTIKEKVDMKKITDSLNSGIANPDAEGTVDDPNDNQSTNQQNQDTEIQLTDGDLRNIEAKYLQLTLQHGEIVADAWLAELKEKGILPKELPVTDQE